MTTSNMKMLLLACLLCMATAQNNSMEARYLERKGAQVSLESPIEDAFCTEGPLPDCLSSMDIEAFEVSYDAQTSNLNGFRTVFSGGLADSSPEGDKFTCTFGQVEDTPLNTYISRPVKPGAQVESVIIAQTSDFILCQIEIKAFFGETTESIKLGSCGVIADEDELIYLSWRFDQESNFFLGIAGAPSGNWFSVSPYVVEIIDDGTVFGLIAEGELQEKYDFWLSPPSKYTADSATIRFPSYKQRNKCK